MQGSQQNRKDIKQRIIRIVAIVCVACFVAVFIFSAATFASHSSHDSEAIAGCQRTLMPECKCESTVAQILIPVQTHEYHESHSDCLACAFIHKTVNQLRHLGAVASELFCSNAGLLLLTALFLIIPCTGTCTPIRLKTKSNN